VVQALWGGAFLAFVVATPVFLGLSWLADLARRRWSEPQSSGDVRKP
jgi:hypothetical protein